MGLQATSDSGYETTDRFPAMDPVSAFGLAVNVMSVVNFGIDTIRLAHEIGELGTVKRIAEFQNGASEVRSVVATLQKGLTGVAASEDDQVRISSLRPLSFPG